MISRLLDAPSPSTSWVATQRLSRPLRPTRSSATSSSVSWLIASKSLSLASSRSDNSASASSSREGEESVDRTTAPSTPSTSSAATMTSAMTRPFDDFLGGCSGGGLPGCQRPAASSTRARAVPAARGMGRGAAVAVERAAVAGESVGGVRSWAEHSPVAVTACQHGLGVGCSARQRSRPRRTPLDAVGRWGCGSWCDSADVEMLDLGPAGRRDRTRRSAPNSGSCSSAAWSSLSVTATLGGLISLRRIFGGDALTAGFVGIHPHGTAWPTAPSTRAASVPETPDLPGTSQSPNRESNSGPTHYECVALPTELSGQPVAPEDATPK